jgi:Rrf2 family protein
MIKVNQKTHHAILAMVEIVEGRKPVTCKTIAAKHGLPERFLIQILIDLRRAGLIESHRGAKGGFTLARPASKITLADIVGIYNDRQPIAFESSNRWVSGAIENVFNETVSDLWRRLRAVRLSMLQKGRAKQ